jgi:hypothetical protein
VTLCFREELATAWARVVPDAPATTPRFAAWKWIGPQPHSRKISPEVQDIPLHHIRAPGLRAALDRAARAKARAAWRLLDIEVAADAASFSYALNRKKSRQVRRREGRYLLRTNLCERDPAQLWQFYIQLVEVEAAFKNLVCNYARSTTNSRNESKHTSSSPSSPIAFR